MGKLDKPPGPRPPAPTAPGRGPTNADIVKAFQDLGRSIERVGLSFSEFHQAAHHFQMPVIRAGDKITCIAPDCRVLVRPEEFADDAQPTRYTLYPPLIPRRRLRVYAVIFFVEIAALLIEWQLWH